MNAFDEAEWEGFSEYKRPETEERRKRRRRRRGGDSGSVFSDPLTAVLLHFDGANGSASFLDSGAKLEGVRVDVRGAGRGSR